MADSQPVLGIRKWGFRRWFERQLTESHVYLVSCILCLILVFAAAGELGSAAGGLKRALMSGLAVGGAVLGLVCLERYRAILSRALHLSGRSTCKNCATYGRFQVLDSTRGDLPEEVRKPWLKVKCANCGHEWIMD